MSKLDDLISVMQKMIKVKSSESAEPTASVKIDLSQHPLTDPDRELVESEAIAEDCERDTDKEIRFQLGFDIPMMPWDVPRDVWGIPMGDK